MLTPEGVSVGQTIHIVVPSPSSSSSSSSSSVSVSASSAVEPTFYPEPGAAAAAAASATSATASSSTVHASQVVYVAEAPLPPPVGLSGVFDQMRLFGDRTVELAKSLDQTYKITDKIVEIATPGKNKLS